MNLDCIAQILINAGLAQGFGQDVFPQHMPAQVEEGLLLRLPMEGVPLNHYIPGYFKGRFQVIVRSKDLAVGEAKANGVCAALNLYGVSFFDLNAQPLLRILQCYSTVLPINYARSDANVFEWSCNFLSHYIMPTPIMSPGGSVTLQLTNNIAPPNALLNAIEGMSTTDRRAFMQSLVGSMPVLSDASAPVTTGQGYISPSGFIVVAK